MKRYFKPCILALIPLLAGLSGCQKNGSRPKVLELNKNWEFRESESQEWMSAKVPGCVHMDLLDNKKIDDPFYRMNEKNLQWIDKKDWEYRCFFSLNKKQLKAGNSEILFKGLDTYADVYLNDSLLFQADNMFRSWNIAVKGLLKEGKNELRILFKSPTRIGQAKLEALGYPLPATNDNSKVGEMGEQRVSVFTRKAPYHYGWDWGPRFVTSGIWRPVEILFWNKGRIEDFYLEQEEVTKEQAKITAHLVVSADQISQATLSILNKTNMAILANKEVQLKKGFNEFDLSFTMDSPDLWWPNGMGNQSLYHLAGLVIIDGKPIDEKAVKIGLRSLKLVRNPDPDSVGESFYFEINGEALFMKGANYIPNDAFLSRVTPEKYQDVIKRATDANMNMLRVWGGGIYEEDYFYDLCDESGILIWQDFMFACSMYPGDEAFLSNIKEEAIENVRRLRNHPSIILWCGNNEIETAWRNWGWQKAYSESQKDEIWNAYDTIFHKILPSVVSKEAPGIPYWWSSPTQGFNILDANKPGRELLSGDMHNWSVWHGKLPFEGYEKAIPRFMSEYGFQSFPELKTIESFTLPSDHEVESEVMNWHQRSAPGNMLIKTYMDMYYRSPVGFDKFLYLNQVLQAKGITLGMEAHRRNKPWCMGTLYWQLNDCWPAPSWSSTDYFGRWKALHYYARKAFSTFLVSPTMEQDSLEVWVVSDSLSATDAQLSLKIMDLKGKLLWNWDRNIQIPSNSSLKVFSAPPENIVPGADYSDLFLYAELKKGKEILSDNSYYFRNPKDVNFPAPSLKSVVHYGKKSYHIELSTDVLAKNVFLDFPAIDGFFSDNYFDLIPGQKKYVRFLLKQDAPTEKPPLSILTLVDSYTTRGEN